MATSGSIDFNMDRDTLIEKAYKKIGALAEGENATATMISDAALELNMIIKAWKTSGINLWCYENITVFPVIGQKTYSIGTAHAAVDYVSTTTSAAASSGASSVTLTSATGISDGDFIGIELDGGDLQWTTVNGAPAGSVVTLDATLTDDVSSGATVYAYTTKANRPPRVTGARWYYSNGQEIPLHEASRHDYENLTLKTSQGSLSQYYYDPQLTNGILAIWQTFASVDELLILTAQRQLYDFDLSTDNPDIPQEAFHALVYKLAYHLSHEENISREKRDSLKLEAEQLFDEFNGYDQETASVQFVPYGDYYR